jgi:hypothetical protein
MRRESFVLALVALTACGTHEAGTTASAGDAAARLARYTAVTLSPDTTTLTPNERKMIPLLVDAAKAMNDAFWMEAYGNGDSLMQAIGDADTRRFIALNFGPWDRLDNDAPFVPGIGRKPAGANYYPLDMTKAEFDSAVKAGGPHESPLEGQYTMVRRDASKKLIAVPYHVMFKAQHDAAAAKLEEAARLADDPGLRKYLQLRAEALRTDQYRASDMAWMDMKLNRLDLVIGPIETYEDGLYGYKTAHEAFVLIKDKNWSLRLAKFATMLPALQRGMPVPDQYKREKPGLNSDLNAYDVVYVAGEANTGGKTIAINLPNDEEVQLQKGARRLQLENVIRAKFDKILLPVARELIAGDQLSGVTFDAFFEDVMFHEVAHGLGIKNTINDKGPVRIALKERASALEEGKADILGLYMIRQLNGQGELGKENIDDNYVTFLASILRSVRFGGADAHGRANTVAFNFLREQGAFTRDSATGKYRVDAAKFKAGTDRLARQILTLQAAGDYEGVGKFNELYGTISAALQQDLDRLKSKSIPVDIVFQQP